MKQSKSKLQPPPVSRQKRAALLIALGALMVAIVAFVVIVVAQGRSSSAPPQMLTLDATTLSNLTDLPAATPLSGTDAQQYLALGQMVDACLDYSTARRSQMHQHIDWIINPSTIPQDIVAVALGPNPRGRLIFGMASYTSSEWILNGRKPGSCLVPIGLRLNQMLVQTGEQPLDVYK